MRFERSDLILFAIATLIALEAAFQENTVVSVILIMAAATCYCFSLYFSSVWGKTTKSFACALIILFSVFWGNYLAQQNFEKEMRRNYGAIYPANEITSSSVCGKPGLKALNISTNTINIAYFPFVFLEIDGSPILVFDKGKNDALSIKYLLLNDTSNDNLATITDNDFWINPSVQRSMVPSRSRLKLADKSGEIALDIASINKNQLLLQGKFVYHKYIVEINQKEIKIVMANGKTLLGMSRNCFLQHAMKISDKGLEMSSPIPGSYSLLVTP